MKLEKTYVCPKCNWSLTTEPKGLLSYTCPVCRNDFKVRPGDDPDSILFFHQPNEFNDEPLGLPRGSVRAIIMILLAIATWYLMLTGERVPNYLLNLLIIVVGYYFAIRTTFKGVGSLGSEKIEIEQDPLYLPKGFIRVFIILGFLVSGLYLWRNGDFSKFAYAEFFYILIGLMLGFAVQKLTHTQKEEDWYQQLSHMKAFVVLIMALGILLLSILDELESANIWGIRIMVASIGFYFSSR